MTTTTMARQPPPSSKTMVTSSSQSSTSQDILDQMFGWTESVLPCHQNVTKDTKPPEEDVLDYVFEKVESFTCDGQERGFMLENDPRNKQHRGGNNSSLARGDTFERDNSLIEEKDGPLISPQNGANMIGVIHPLNGVLSRQYQAQQQHRGRQSTKKDSPSPTKKNGGKADPDVLDYVFEHVESYTCAENAPSNALDHMSNLQSHFAHQQQYEEDMNYKAAKQRVENIPQQQEEESIQLYFKPQKSKSKNNKRNVYQG